MYLRRCRVATTGLWGLALLLAILNAALFIESAARSLPLLSLAGSLFVARPAGRGGRKRPPRSACCRRCSSSSASRSSWSADYLWASESAAPRRGCGRRQRTGVGHGLWLALLAHLFLLARRRRTSHWAVPPWPLFGALAVVALAFSTAALAAQQPAIHIASTVDGRRHPASRGACVAQPPRMCRSSASRRLACWRVFALAWIRVMRARSPSVAAITAAVGDRALRVQPEHDDVDAAAGAVRARRSPRTSSASSCCWRWRRYQWPWRGTAQFAVLAGGAAAAILLDARRTPGATS